MPGEVDRVTKHPLSFYGSHKSKNSYCTRQAVGGQQIGLNLGLNANSNKLMLYSRMNGRKSRLTFGSSSHKIPVTVHQNASALAPRHCRYINMQVRRFPRRQLASGNLNDVNGTKLSEPSSPTRCRPNVSTVQTSLMEKALAKSRESRVLISAELKNKADSKMKNIMNVCKSADSARDRSSNTDGSDHKKSDDVKVADGAEPEKSYDKGLQLRNGRSLPECKDIQQEKSVNRTAGRQSRGNRHGTKVKKCQVQYRSRSLSPTRQLAFSRPRRSANAKRSVCSVLSSYLEVIIS